MGDVVVLETAQNVAREAESVGIDSTAAIKLCNRLRTSRTYMLGRDIAGFGIVTERWTCTPQVDALVDEVAILVGRIEARRALVVKEPNRPSGKRGPKASEIPTTRRPSRERLIDGSTSPWL